MGGSEPDTRGLETIDDVLEHFGVRGMKWGVRRRKTSGPLSPDAAKAKEVASLVKKHGTSAVSNKDLQALVTRMNLEKQYSGLTAKPKRSKDGEKFVKDMLSLGNTANQAMQFAKSPMGKMMGKMFKAAAGNAAKNHGGGNGGGSHTTVTVVRALPATARGLKAVTGGR